MSKATKKAFKAKGKNKAKPAKPMRASRGSEDGRALRVRPFDFILGFPKPGDDPQNTSANLFPGGPNTAFVASGTVAAGTVITSVRLFLADGSEAAAPVIDPTGWTAAFNAVTSLPPNTTLRLLIVSTDATGQQNARALSFSMRPPPAPANAPSLTAITPAPGGNRNLKISGTTVNVATLTVTGDVPASTDTGLSGNSFGPFETNTTSSSQQSFTFTATNSAGDSADFDFTFNLDTTPPFISDLIPTAITTNANFTVTGNATEASPGSGVDKVTATIDPTGTPVQKDADTSALPAFTLAVNVSDLQEGDNTIRFVATDHAGNDSTAVDVVATVDTKKPVVSGLTSTIPSPTNQSFTITGDIADPAPSSGIQGVSAVITKTGSAAGAPQPVSNFSDTTLSFLVDVSTLAGDGDYTVKFTATDNAGNASVVNAAATYSFTLDTTPPTIDPTLDPGTATMPTKSDFTLTGTATDDGSGVDKVRVNIITGSTINPQADADFSGDPSFTFHVDVTALGDGDHTVQFIAVDNAGNESTPVLFVVTVDRTRPTATLLPDPTRVLAAAVLLVSYSEDMNDAAFDKDNYDVDGITGVSVNNVIRIGGDQLAEVVLSFTGAVKHLQDGQSGTLNISSPPTADKANNALTDASTSIDFTVQAGHSAHT